MGIGLSAALDSGKFRDQRLSSKYPKINQINGSLPDVNTDALAKAPGEPVGRAENAIKREQVVTDDEDVKASAALFKVALPGDASQLLPDRMPRLHSGESPLVPKDLSKAMEAPNIKDRQGAPSMHNGFKPGVFDKKNWVEPSPYGAIKTPPPESQESNKYLVDQGGQLKLGTELPSGSPMTEHDLRDTTGDVTEKGNEALVHYRIAKMPHTKTDIRGGMKAIKKATFLTSFLANRYV